MSFIFNFFIFFFLFFLIFKKIRKLQLKNLLDFCKNHFEQEEKILCIGHYTNCLINLISFLYAISFSCLSQNKSYDLILLGMFLFFTISVLSYIVITINFKQAVILTNLSVIYTYNKEPKFEKIEIKNISEIKYIWCFRPFIELKLKNGEIKTISHMSNSKKIKNLVNQILNNNR